MRIVSQRAALLALLALALILSACALPRAAAQSDLSPGRATSGPPKTVVACIDVTLSVPPSIIPNTLKLLSREVAMQPRPGSGQFVMYVRTISDNSMTPSNNLKLVNVPAVPRAQYKVSQTLDPNPIKTQVARYNASAHSLQTRSLQRARAIARRNAYQVLHLRVRHDTRVGTDLYACPAVASRLLPPAGPTYLLVVSDLLPYGKQHSDLTDFRLPGTHVIIVQFCDTDIRVCNGARDHFEKDLRKGGASRIDFYDSTSLPIMSNIFNP